MKPVVLFRETLADQKEIEACSKHFKVIGQRGSVQPDQLVIARYSALPYYNEFERDIALHRSKLINTYSEHQYVADLRNWYPDLEGLTPKTWFELHEVPRNEGPFVLKGATNSKKHSWNTHMFAKDWTEAGEVHSRLLNDGFVGSQDIYIRKYVPLKKLANGFKGLPITEEYRFFIYNDTVLTGGFYWSEWWDDLSPEIDIDPRHVPRKFLQEVIDRVSGNIPFYVVDIARTEAGDWIVIELNDGQQSGLSMNDPEVLYKNLREQVDKEINYLTELSLICKRS